MDQTTITVVGMIAAFITAAVTAFLAEPVKIYFQARSDRKNLRIALYKELLHNYFLLEQTLASSKADSGISRYTMEIMGEFNLRTECYRHAISNQLNQFYQLADATEFNQVYSILALAINLPAMNAAGAEEPLPEEGDARLIARAAGEFIDFTAQHFYTGKFDKELLEKLVSNKRYSRIMNRGQYVAQKILYPETETRSGPEATLN